jgi:Ca2+-binding RTX toxin-like protein
MTIHKWGSEQLVNTTTDEFQFFPRIAGLSDGGFVVVWADNSATGGDTSGIAVRMQRYDAYGNKVAAETIVNTTTLGSQTDPAVTALEGGGFVVTWTDASGANGTNVDIRFRRFDADGVALDASDQVIGVASEQVKAEVVAAPGGGFIVAFRDIPGGTFDISAQGFDANGAANTGLINAALGAPEQTDPAIARLSDNTFVAVWDDDTNAQIRFQRFDGAGNFLGATTAVAGSPTNPSTPSIVGLANGGFVVAWHDTNQPFPDDQFFAVRAQIFDGSGAAVGSEIAINTFATNNQTACRLVALPSGGFAAIYTSNQDIRGQVFDALGNRVGSEFLVNTSTTGAQLDPDIAVLADGRLAIVWTDQGVNQDPDDHGVLMQIIDPRDGAVFGTNNAETLLGHDQVNDQLNGLSGNDLLDGLAGQDFMFGGEGNDTYMVDNAGDRIFEIAGQGTDTVQSSVSFTLGDNVENLTLMSSATGGIGNSLANVITGNASANMLNGMGGGDTMTGGAGNDTYIIDNAGDVVTETSSTGGTDIVLSSVSFTLGAWIENLRLTGSANISGTGNTLANVITGNSGANTLNGDARNDTLNGGTGNDRLNGGANNDTLLGSSGNDRLDGGSHADTLNGGSGNDRLTGGLGRDIMTGSTGFDDFDFNAVNETGKTSSTRDIIRDFAHNVDDIDLSTIDARTTTAGNQKFIFLAAEGAAFTGVAGQLRFDQQNNAGTANDRTIIEGDVNGNGGADFQIELRGLKTLAAGDFIL